MLLTPITKRAIILGKHTFLFLLRYNLFEIACVCNRTVKGTVRYFLRTKKSGRPLACVCKRKEKRGMQGGDSLKKEMGVKENLK